VHTTYNINGVNRSIPKLYQPHIACYLLKWVKITTKLPILPSLCLPRESNQGGATFFGAFFSLFQSFPTHLRTRLPFPIDIPNPQQERLKKNFTSIINQEKE